MTENIRPPLPPFTAETAAQKVRAAENAWNTHDPEKIALAYTVDSQWRNRAQFLTGREQIVQFLQQKWAKELDYRLIKELWAFHEARIAVRFAYEWHDDSGNWFRSYGNENWEFDAKRPDEAPHSQHQRLADSRGGAEISLAAGAETRQSSRSVRTWILRRFKAQNEFDSG